MTEQSTRTVQSSVHARVRAVLRSVAAPAAVAALAACAAAPRPAGSPAPTPAAPTTASGAPSAVAAPAPVRPAETRETLRAGIDSLVLAPAFRNANWGVLIVDADRGDTLYSRNAGKLFLPASNQKLLTGSVALALLGPDYRYRTVLATSAGARSSGDEVRGDLWVVGRGDPTVSDHMRGDAMAPLLAMADTLAARGVKRVTGALVAASDFAGPPLGYGWAWDDLDFPYSAGVDGLMFNEGFTRVVVRGAAKAGGRPTAFAVPARRVPIRVTATTAARPAGVSAEDALTITADGGGAAPNAVLVGGVVAPGDSVMLEVAHRAPAAAYAAAFAEALERRGIRVAGGWRLADSGGRPALDTLATVLSPPLREILPALEKPSQNQIAEVLFRTLGLERAGVGSADSGRRVVERQLALWGAPPDGFAVRDGSGLSRHDFVSPETIVHVLAAARRDTAFRVFYDALPIAGVDGTIRNRMKGTPAQGNVHAKTGYVDKARSLSGYVTTADGHVLLFSFLANNWTTPTKEVERVQDAIAARLAAMRLGGATAAATQ